MGAKDPPPIGLEEKDWVRWTWRGDESFMERKEETWGGEFPPPNYLAGVVERMASDLHDDTTECLGGLALATLVGHFSVLR